MSTADRKQPYSGLKVIDFTMGWAGPSLTQMLADHGADVIKVESHTRTDWWRTSRGLFVSGEEDLDQAWEWSMLFNAVNENKRGITLDLAHNEGRRIARELMVEADVVVENYTPRVMASFNLDYESIAPANPGLIMVSMPAFGTTGPWADYKATAFVTESAAGVSWLSGPPAEPQLSSTGVADPNAGVVGALSVALAIRARRRSGRGQRVEVAQIEALTPFVGRALLEHQIDGELPERRGNRSGSVSPQGIYPANGVDRWIAISCATDDQWQELCGILRIPVRAAWTTVAGRLAEADAVDEAVSSACRNHDAAELAARLQEQHIAAGAVQDAEGVLMDPHLNARHFFRQVERAVVGTQPYPQPPVRLSGTPARRHRPAPTLGEHNHEVLADELQLAPDEIQHLEEIGVIGDAPRARE